MTHHRRDPDHGPAADELQRRLAEQAHAAPSGELLAERVIARAEAIERARTRSTPPWGRLLAVAAAIVAVAAVGVAVTVARNDGDTDRDQAARSTAPLTPQTSTVAPPTSAAATSSSPEPESSQSRKITVPTLTGVRVRDVTFTGGGNGWALATADCLRSSGTCSALLHTDDGGDSWQSRPGTPFTVTADRTCTQCVSHLRFATDTTGYAYGRGALFLTTDGARHWRKLDGGADALETLDDNVIRVSSDATGCPPGCDYQVQIADVGDTDWTDVSLPGTSGPGDGVVLARSGSAAYLLGLANPAGGAGRATATLWTSANDGRSWRNRGEPCAQTGGEVDAQSVTTAADGAVVVLCRQRTGGRQAIAVSTDRGARFATGPFTLGAAQAGVLGAASSRIVLVSSDQTYRSIDGGRRFARTPGVEQLAYLGFASDSDAHAIAADGTTIYTTRDAGKSWRAAQFD